MNARICHAEIYSPDALGRVPPDAPPFFTVCTLAWSVNSVDDLPFPGFEETMLVGRRVGAAQSRRYILATQAAAARLGGRFDEAGVMLDQALRMFESLGDRTAQAHILAQRGHLLRSLGDPATARECFRSAADLRAEIPDQRGTAIALTGVALAEAALGDGQRARALGHEACRMMDRSGDLTGHAGALNNLAVAEVLSGRPEQAIGLLEQALALRDPQPRLAVHAARGPARDVGGSWPRLPSPGLKWSTRGWMRDPDPVRGGAAGGRRPARRPVLRASILYKDVACTVARVSHRVRPGAAA